jgi:hypothetical protein
METTYSTALVKARRPAPSSSRVSLTTVKFRLNCSSSQIMPVVTASAAGNGSAVHNLLVLPKKPGRIEKRRGKIIEIRTHIALAWVTLLVSPG